MTEEKTMVSILIIEDDAEYRNNMELILEMEGFKVRVAANGQDAFDLMNKELPDLILCDIMMPEMDGHTFFSSLKEDVAFADVAFIFVTALADRADLRKAMAAGADDYLTKPFKAEELVAAVVGRLGRIETLRKSLHEGMQKAELIFLKENSTAREVEVLLLVGCGLTSRQIADQLGISIRTVEHHRTNLMYKLDAPNAAALAHWAQIAKKL